MKLFQPLGGVFIGVGAAAVATGAVLYVMGTRHSPAHATLAPAPGGFVLSGEF
jgi:hypothetical protein